MPVIFASLIILAPLYVWRFVVPIGNGLPTNFLMLANFVVVGVGVLMMWRGSNDSGIDGVTKKMRDVFAELGRPLSVAIGLFGLASVISLVAFGVNGEKFAQWMVLYAQPLIIFFLIKYFLPSAEIDMEARQRWVGYFYGAAYIVVGAAGVLAMVQYFTLLTLPPAWWGNANEPKRSIAFFAHANAFGLFVTPLLAWLISDVVRRIQLAWESFRQFGFAVYKKDSHFLVNKYCTVLWTLGVVGMFLSLSRGAWLGFLAAAIVYALVAANKKMLIGFAAAGIILVGVVTVVPNLRYRVLLPFHGEKSTVARFSLWDTAGKMIADSPVLGKGVNGFSDNWDKYNTDAGLEHYNFPHNILLNFWVDLGFLGVVSMMAILLASAWRGFTQRKTSTVALGLLLFIVAMVAHGLIDIPYLKNDLALMFWIVLALGL